MDRMELYNKLPIWGQNLACYAEGMRIKKTRYGKTFWSALSEYESHDNWSYEQLCEYRDNRLRRMIQHCYKTVPYYTKIFHDGGINPDSIRTLDDLKVLPILTKDEVNRHPEDFISNLVPRKKQITGHTSGTTGSGFVFKTTQEAICEQWAVWWRYRRRLGIKIDDLCGLFGGRSVVPTEQSAPPYFRYNLPNHILYFSTYHLNDDNMQHYIKVLSEKNIQWLHGYPSAITVLAEYLCTHKIDLPMMYVTTGAENLLSMQKERIENAFHTKVYQHYGMSEAVANFSENIAHEMFVDEDFSATEFIPVIETGRFEIVGTNLTNYAMPLLRYKTNDLCDMVYTNKGRLVSSIDGRLEDYVVLPNGTKIGRLDHVFKDLVNIREAQILQKSVNNIVVRVVKGTDYEESDEIRLKGELELRLKGIQIEVIYVDSIERTSSGKLRFVVSEIK